MAKKRTFQGLGQPSRQLELDIRREKENDRNYDLGGRSFYFFDFDDNVAFLATPCFLFHKKTNEELEVSSGEFASHSADIGKRGPYKDYYVDFDDVVGTFRLFRDQQFSLLEKLLFRGRQRFVKDVREALQLPDLQWKGPSWDCFYHAAFNRRPLSVITARGHHPETIERGIREFVKSGDIPHEPNFLAIYPVSHPRTREQLGDLQAEKSVAELKRAAIRQSVKLAFEKYGFSKHHRFGMSDDDPKNIELIHSEMEELKKTYPENSFYVIETKVSGYLKREVQAPRKKRPMTGEAVTQFSLLDPLPN